MAVGGSPARGGGAEFTRLGGQGRAGRAEVTGGGDVTAFGAREGLALLVLGRLGEVQAGVGVGEGLAAGQPGPPASGAGLPAADPGCEGIRGTEIGRASCRGRL